MFLSTLLTLFKQTVTDASPLRCLHCPNQKPIAKDKWKVSFLAPSLNIQCKIAQNINSSIVLFYELNRLQLKGAFHGIPRQNPAMCNYNADPLYNVEFKRSKKARLEY